MWVFTLLYVVVGDVFPLSQQLLLSETSMRLFGSFEASFGIVLMIHHCLELTRDFCSLNIWPGNILPKLNEGLSAPVNLLVERLYLCISLLHHPHVDLFAWRDAVVGLGFLFKMLEAYRLMNAFWLDFSKQPEYPQSRFVPEYLDFGLQPLIFLAPIHGCEDAENILWSDFIVEHCLSLCL